ncbi:thermonuclease family protein [Mycoplasmopsis agassizii]|uniref:thermonuclease family protein n=1 Tax=Mycoplasmopsis agassizii TaxID=33922 RepID=UPI0035298E93
MGFYYAKQAKEFTSNLILNKNIKYKLIKLDKYKRSVAKVFTDDNLDLAKKLISEGLAILAYFSTNKKDFYYYNDEKYYKELLQEQSNAQINKKGFWKESSEKLKTIFPKHYK